MMAPKDCWKAMLTLENVHFTKHFNILVIIILFNHDNIKFYFLMSIDLLTTHTMCTVYKCVNNV